MMFEYLAAGDYCMAVDPYQRRDCGPFADNATCLEKGCCYDDAYYGDVRRCFYSSSRCRLPSVLTSVIRFAGIKRGGKQTYTHPGPCTFLGLCMNISQLFQARRRLNYVVFCVTEKVQCGVDIRKRKQCGSPDVDKKSCEDQNCCFDPEFYGNYTIYCYAPETGKLINVYSIGDICESKNKTTNKRSPILDHIATLLMPDDANSSSEPGKILDFVRAQFFCV